MVTKTKTQPEARTDGHLIRTKNDLPVESRQKMVQLLNQQLADTFDLFSLTKQAHWNVKGPQFFQLHELYDSLAGQLIDDVDMIAERATTLGGPATGTVRMAGKSTRLPEAPSGFMDSKESVEMLVERYALLAHSTREAIEAAEQADDQDTMDLFIEVSRQLDKSLWFLESHIQQVR